MLFCSLVFLLTSFANKTFVLAINEHQDKQIRELNSQIAAFINSMFILKLLCVISIKKQYFDISSHKLNNLPSGRFAGNKHVTLVEVKSTSDTSYSGMMNSDAKMIKNSKRSAQHQLQDHVELLQASTDLGMYMSTILTHISYGS
jgi:hypothetical protein